MSATTEAIEIIEALQKSKISKQTATKLIDYVESRKGDYATKEQVNTVKLGVFLLSGFMVIMISIMIYLHSDTKADMQAMESMLIRAIEKKR